MSLRLSEKHGVNPTLLICAICGEPTNEMALLGHNGGKKAEMYSNAGTLCDLCKECVDNKGAVLICMDKEQGEAGARPTGQIVHVRSAHVAKALFTESYDNIASAGHVGRIGPKTTQQLLDLNRMIDERVEQLGGDDVVD